MPTNIDAMHRLCGRAAVVLAVSAVCALGARADTREETREIAPGVVESGSSLEPDRMSIDTVWIRPPRSAGAPSPDLAPLLDAAFDWCAGNTERGARRTESGMASHSGCSIRVESGPYRIGRTAILRQRRELSPVDIDLGSAAILHFPDKPRSVRVADIPSLACDPKHEGDYYEVSDAESLDDFTHADPDGDVPIESIELNRESTPGCPNGGAVCKYGGHAVRVTTAKPHGLTAGGPFELGDIAVFSVPNTPYDGKRLLVKEVVGKKEFIVTPEFEPAAARGGSVRETATTIWCNGHRWRAGKPMIAIGGPGHVRMSRISLHGGKFSVDGILYRTSAVLVDGDKGSDGRGGAEWIDVDTTHNGNSDLRGQIVVDMGTARESDGICQHIHARVYSDAWGPSWSPSVRNTTCRFADLEVHQGHGGGVWIGTDEPGVLGPTPVALSGALLGCKDGPCLWVRSGTVQFGPGFAVMGSQFGPLHDPPGPFMGLVAILGGPPGTLANVIAHGTGWNAGQESDLDCYVWVGDRVTFVQQGGTLAAGNGAVGVGDDTLFCSAPGTRAADFVLEHTQNQQWGGKPKFVDVRH
jgi:hypothetical protein